MKPKVSKYKITETHDVSINACSVYMALIRQDHIYLMPERLNINKHDNDIIAASRQWGRYTPHRAAKPHPEFVVLASYPDSQPAMAIYGPLHKKSHHSMLVLINNNDAWYIKIKDHYNSHTEAKIIKKIQFNKLRKTLIDESLKIYQDWVGEQFH